MPTHRDRRSTNRLPIVACVALATALTIASVSAVAASSNGLTGKTWQLTALVGKKPVAGTSLTATFTAKGQVSGSSGCNTYGGSYTVSGSTIRMPGPFVSTQMACKRAIMVQEAAYLKALRAARTFSVKRKTLQLMGSSGRVIAAYAEQSQSLAGTSWHVLSYNNGKQAVVSVIIDTELTARFDKSGNVTGSAGCNDYHGTYKATAPKVSFGPLSSTKKFCGEPDGVMEQESAYLEALADSATYRITGPRLEFRNASGAITVDLERS